MDALAPGLQQNAHVVYEHLQDKSGRARRTGYINFAPAGSPIQKSFYEPARGLLVAAADQQAAWELLSSVWLVTDDQHPSAIEFLRWVGWSNLILRDKTMATITLTKLSCVKKQDLAFKDEPVLYIAGQEVWSEKMGKGDFFPVNKNRDFGNSVRVELKEKNGSNNYKTLGSWDVIDQPTTDHLTATSSGYLYYLYYNVSV